MKDECRLVVINRTVDKEGLIKYLGDIHYAIESDNLVMTNFNVDIVDADVFKVIAVIKLDS